MIIYFSGTGNSPAIRLHITQTIGVVCLLVICVVGSLLQSCSRSDQNLTKDLQQLSYEVDHRSEYQTRKMQQMDSVRMYITDTTDICEQIELYGKLIEMVRSFSVDSLQVYTAHRLELAEQMGNPFYIQMARLNRAELFNLMGMYLEARQWLDKAAEQPIHPNLLPYYYHLERTFWGYMQDYASTYQEQCLYKQKAMQYRDSLMMIHPEGSFLHTLVLADKQYEEGDYMQSLQSLQEYEDKNIIFESEKGIFAIMKAKIYSKLGDKRHEEEQLIISASADLKNAVREYISLRELAILLYEQGNVRLSYKFIQCSLNDALACNARLRSIELGKIFPLIEDAYRKSERQTQHFMLYLTISIATLMIVLVILVIYRQRQMKRLQAARQSLFIANEELNEANNRLEQANQIKTAYVGRYMEMCSYLIDRFDNYRRDLNRLGKDNKINELLKELGSQKFTQEQLAAFYKDFDEAFLNIFPDFIDNVQSLLRDDAEPLRFKNGERLNTDLRVCALIRLGITDSKQIAGFLRYSLPTIYNSRTRMRNMSKGDRQDFEQKLTTL